MKSHSRKPAGGRSVRNPVAGNITPCVSVDPQVAAMQYGPTNPGAPYVSRPTGEMFDIRAQQSDSQYDAPLPWFVGLTGARTFPSMSGSSRPERGMTPDEQTAMMHSLNPEYDMQQVVDAMLELFKSNDDSVDGIVQQPMPEDHPWHDAHPMTQELSDLAWQQALSAQDAELPEVVGAFDSIEIPDVFEPTEPEPDNMPFETPDGLPSDAQEVPDSLNDRIQQMEHQQSIQADFPDPFATPQPEDPMNDPFLMGGPPLGL